MKLNVKRTLLVGLAFMSISAFWQLYDAAVPLMLKNDFGLNDFLSNSIMSLDNILALFLLPLFGLFSDRCGIKIGRRMPFIMAGTAAAALMMLQLPGSARIGNQAMFYVGLGVLLLSMGIYRSPAVALMPDVTPKPLRSKGNAVINLMGALGGVFTLLATLLLVKKPDDSFRADYTPVFLAVAAFMVISVAALALTVKERKLVKQMEDIHYGVDPKTEQAAQITGSGTEKLPPALYRSLLLILTSVFLWFMGYNAVTTTFTKYAQEMWNMDIGAASACMMVATIGAIVSYLPVGIFSAKFGRKRMIQFGIILLSLCFASGLVFTAFTPALYVMFALVGCAWACINVNSYPMVVELSRGASVGKYTGYYYTFSMAAQVVTPILSGFLLQYVGYWTLFPYSAVMVALAFITISLTKHGDSRPGKPQSKLEAFQAED